MADLHRLENLAFEVASALGVDPSAFQVSTLGVASHLQDVEVELEPGGEHFSVNLIHFFEGKTLVKLNFHAAGLWQLGRDVLHFEVVAFLSIRLSFRSGRPQYAAFLVSVEDYSRMAE